MAFENDTFRKLFDEIAFSNQDGNHYQLKGRLLINGEEIFIAEIVTIKTIRDYINGIYDVTIMSISVPNTIYTDKIYPNKRSLELELRFEIAHSLGYPIENPEFWIRKYKAILVTNIDPETIQVDKFPVKGSEKALSAMAEIKLQLVDKIAYEMKGVTCANVYPNVTMEKLIRSLLSYRLGREEVRTALIRKEFEEVRGVDIVPPDNESERNVIVPYNVTIFDLPLFLQENYGVYSTKIGAYYQTNYTHDDFYQSVKGGMWFVYPVFNFKRYERAPRKLNVLIVPEREAADVENTFTYYDKNLSIITSGKSTAVDITEKTFFELGNGVVYAKSSELLDDLHYTEDNRLYPKTQETMKSFVVKNRPDGLNDIRTVKGNYTNNPFYQASKLSGINVKVITVQWSTSMPDLLIPGMPTKLVYHKEGSIVEKYAVLINVNITHKSLKSNNQNQTFVSHTVLTFAVELNEED